MRRKMARDPDATPREGAAAVRKELSKISLVQDLLRREQGATLAELVEATGWLPHTTRAALTGLKKKGHVIGKAKVDGVTRYMTTGTAAQ
jgi:hypothetical protein